ncbi:MAG: hypothetical protein LKG26_03300 [Saccharofermentans sp.]|jgi:hypothetical protein|nr:hypothetical protein [Mageeibacillus sp.]MCI1264391.1 hypothetical protein [Saccharofermentans sp.]MCI1275098.1 hypothetical protein [Saccharofermentans sp.]MCI1769539.1 hypothetical protein [Mageeibacillus sp.]MCI2044372.1 hypothetical protein [Mageeibacillus sp.]
MNDELRDNLKRYDEIAGIILESKLDEFSSKMGQKPEDVDDETFDEYIQRSAMSEVESQSRKLEEEPDDRLGGMSMHEYIDELELDEKLEALEYCALHLDRDIPGCLIASIAEEDNHEKVKEYCANVIGDCAWCEGEHKDKDTLFEMEFQKVKAALKVLTQMKEPCFVKAVLDRFMSYSETTEFVADSIASYIEAFPDVSVPYLVKIISDNEDTGLEGPCEDAVIMLTTIGLEHPSEEIYESLRHAFRFMNNKIYAVICLANYGDKRAAALLKNYINRNTGSIDRELFYEMMSAIQNLGGDISDIHDPFGDFRKKMNPADSEGKKSRHAGYNGNR